MPPLRGLSAARAQPRRSRRLRSLPLAKLHLQDATREERLRGVLIFAGKVEVRLLSHPLDIEGARGESQRLGRRFGDELEQLLGRPSSRLPIEHAGQKAERLAGSFIALGQLPRPLGPPPA